MRTLSRPSIMVLLLAGGFLLLLIAPMVLTGSYARHLLIVSLVYAIVAANWDLSLGYAGLFNFAHLAFFGIGLYVSAILTKLVGIDPWLAMPLAGLCTAAAAALVSLPVIRLRGIYVVLVTFAFGQLVQQIVLSQADVTGGSQGMVMVPSLRIGTYNFARDGKLAYCYAAIALFTISLGFLYWLVRSRVGLSIRAVRDDEAYAAARGLSLARTHFLAIVLSAPLTGVAGAFFGAYSRVASTEVFGFGTLSLVLSMVLLGGAGTLFGPVIAAFVLTFVSEALVDLGLWRFLVISGGMIIVLILFPGGLASIVGSSWASRAKAGLERGRSIFPTRS
jgi:branched-chain amino acid transport system permease protein